MDKISRILLHKVVVRFKKIIQEKPLCKLSNATYVSYYYHCSNDLNTTVKITNHCTTD